MRFFITIKKLVILIVFPSFFCQWKYFIFIFDSSKRLWIGTEHDGLYRWMEGQEALHLVSAQHVSSIFEDSSRNIWVGTWNGGIFLFDSNDTMRNLRASLSGEPSLSSDFVRCFQEDNRGNIWIGTEAGLDCMDIVTGRLLHYGERVDSYGLTHSSVWCMQRMTRVLSGQELILEE